MKYKLIIICLAAIGLAQSGFAYEKLIHCTARGKCLSQKGGGLLPAKADLEFTDKTARGKPRVLKNVEGRVVTNPEDEDGGSYIGNFKIRSVTENPDYKPTKYKGFSQFQKFNATDTEGSSESGMWGEFVLDKKTDRDTFKAHYIFQAGDHMGGTLHFNCEVVEEQ